MGKPRFEESWREVFDGAESGVPDSVWSKIEMDLVQAEGMRNKRRVVYYQRIAAAVALFAASLAAYVGYQQLTNKESYSIAETTQLENIQGNSNAVESKQIEQQKLENEEEIITGETYERKGEANAQPSSSHAIPIGRFATPALPMTGLFDPQAEDDESHIVSKKGKMKPNELAYVAPSILPHKIKLQRKEFYKTNFPRRLPAMPAHFMASRKDKEPKKENLWASLGFAGGSYSPGEGSGSSGSSLALADKSSISANSFEPQSSQASVGSSYSFGISVGKQVTKKWIVQTGLNYLSQSIDYTSNYTSVSSRNTLEAAIADYSPTEFTSISFTSPYTIRSAIEYFSIPIQAGYLIINRKFGLQLNVGVSTDFFLKNTLIDESGQTEKFSLGAGAASPYRSVNWSGLSSVELSHKLAERASVSIVPGIHYSFNSILKDDAGLAYNSLVFDVGLRLRYVFK